jgi:hypothetical protein
MRQFIAPQMLKVDGGPCSCECHDNVVCWACVQANLILWERDERSGEERNEKLCQDIREYGIRRTAKNLGIRHATVARWLKSGRINPSYLTPVKEVVRGEG